MDDKLKQRLQKHIEAQRSEEFTEMSLHRNRSRIIDRINNSISKNPRVVVTLGCSFAFGQGAYTQDTLDIVRPQGGKFSNFDYVYKEHDLKDLLDLCEQQKLWLNRRPETGSNLNNAEGDFEVITRPLETNNSYVNKVAEILDYVPVNLAQLGNGNQSTVNRLFSYPIDWHKCEKIVVIWAYTDMNRYDVVNDGKNDYQYVGEDYKTMWPVMGDYDPSTEKFHQGSDWHNAQYFMTKTAWSELYSYIHFIISGNKINTWCKAHNAELITMGAFEYYSKETAELAYTASRVHRDHNHQATDLDFNLGNCLEYASGHKEANMKALEMFPWDSVWKPGGENTFFDLCLAQERNLQGLSMHDIVGSGGTPDDWVFPCGHPSGKSHEFLAQLLVNDFKDRL